MVTIFIFEANHQYWLLSCFASLWVPSTTQFVPRSKNVDIRGKTHAMLKIYATHARSTVLLSPRQTGEPQIYISSTPPSNKLSIGAAINLTCTAWQTVQLAKDKSWTKPHRIDWFDPQGKRIGSRCQARSPVARLMKCTVVVGKLGNYTCRARNAYDYCSTKKFQVGLQQGKKKKRLNDQFPLSSYGARVRVH